MNDKICGKIIGNILYSSDFKKIYKIVKLMADEEFIIPDGIEEICESAFFLQPFKKVIFPESLKKIGNEAFACTSVEELIFNSRNVLIDTYAFKDCHNLKSISFPYGTNLKDLDKNFYDRYKKIIRIEPAPTIEALIDNNKSFKEINELFKNGSQEQILQIFK